MMKNRISVVILVMFTSIAAASPSGAAGEKKEFIGSEKCKMCHAVEYKSWKDSFHAKIIQLRKGGILKDASEKWAHGGPTRGNATGATYTLDDVKYVVGSRWKQRYLVNNDQTGNLQFMDKQFNRLKGTWENYEQKNDWNTQCAGCHTTGYRITSYDESAKKTVKSAFSEMGVACEACHGPGSLHMSAKRTDKKKTIVNPARLSTQAQSKICGYCHVRVETEKWRTSQGNPRQDMPAPKLGEAYIAGEDWTAWQGIVMPGIQPDQPFTKEYTGDLKGLFMVDDHAKANGIYEEAMNHQQYQGFIQSTHYKTGKVSCISCHNAHAGKGKVKKYHGACKTCHPKGDYTVEKYMPNTGSTADGLFVRSHTFSKNPRKGGKGAADMGAPNYSE